MTAVRFTLADMERAADAWSCSCGPAALAAICGLTLDEVRPHFGAFPGYTNPTLMFAALRSVGRPWVSIGVPRASCTTWPIWGLARIQWEGPWMQPGVPAGARYQRTHWVGVSRLRLPNGSEAAAERCIWDVNQLYSPTCSDGWSPLAWWTARTVPALTHDIPRATGGWHVTHAIEVQR